MATNPLRPSSGPVTTPAFNPPMPAVAQILSRYDRSQLEAFLAVAIDLIDVMDGDPDEEEAESTDAAYVEWQSKPPRLRRSAGAETSLGEEDDELAGDETDICFAEDDFGLAAHRNQSSPGCAISDPGGCEHDGSEHDEFGGHFSDPGAYRDQLKRIWATRCDRQSDNYGRVRYWLKDPYPSSIYRKYRSPS